MDTMDSMNAFSPSFRLAFFFYRISLQRLLEGIDIA